MFNIDIYIFIVDVYINIVDISYINIVLIRDSGEQHHHRGDRKDAAALQSLHTVSTQFGDRFL